MKLVVDKLLFQEEISYVMVQRPFIKKNIENLINQGVTPILNLYQMVHPMEVENCLKEIEPYFVTTCLFYLTDIGLAYRMKKLGLIHRVIYDPITMITNHLDALSYADYGFLAVGVSNEIPLQDVMTIASKVKTFYQVFGARLMFHSARNLISLYGNKINQSLGNGNYYLKEATRDERYLTIQKADGTYIYRNYYLCLLKEILKLNVEYAYISSLGLTDEVYEQVVSLFVEVLQTRNVELVLKKLSDLNLQIEDGFLYQDTIYQREDF